MNDEGAPFSPVQRPGFAGLSRRTLLRSAALAAPFVALGGAPQAQAATVLSASGELIVRPCDGPTTVELPVSCAKVTYEIKGGDGSMSGGGGAYNCGSLSIVPSGGTVMLTLIAGGRGIFGNPQFVSGNTGGIGYGNGGSMTWVGYTAGGYAHSSSGGGGGGSALLLGELCDNKPLVVAGGGGGGSSMWLQSNLGWWTPMPGSGWGRGGRAGAPGSLEGNTVPQGVQVNLPKGLFYGTNPAALFPAGQNAVGAAGGYRSQWTSWAGDAAASRPTNAWATMIRGDTGGGNRGTGQYGGGNGGHGNANPPENAPSWNSRVHFCPGGCGGGGYAGGGGGASIVACRTNLSEATARVSMGIPGGAGSSFVSGTRCLGNHKVTPEAGSWRTGGVVSYNGDDGYVRITWG